MDLVKIEYDKQGRPANLPDSNPNENLLLYGRDGELAAGPVLGNWCSTFEEWSDQETGVLEWCPTYYAVPPINPEKSHTPPTVSNEIY